MQYKLTEEQSVHFHEKLTNAVDLLDRTKAEGLKIFRTWYEQYLEAHSSFFGFKPWSIKKFGKKFCHGDGIAISNNPEHVRLYSLDDWAIAIKPNKLAKLLKRDVSEVTDESCIVAAALFIEKYSYREYKVWKDMLNKMNTYMSVPYTIDHEWLTELEHLDMNTEYYSITMRNIK